MKIVQLLRQAVELLDGNDFSRSPAVVGLDVAQRFGAVHPGNDEQLELVEVDRLLGQAQGIAQADQLPPLQSDGNGFHRTNSWTVHLNNLRCRIELCRLYHPAGDRTFANTMSVWETQVGWDMVSSIVKEFWSEIRRAVGRHQGSALQP